MFKKVMKIVLVLVVIASIGAFIFVKNMLSSMDQVSLQYDKEKISEHKRELDYSNFEEALLNVGDKRLVELESYIVEKSIEEVRAYLENGRITVEEIVLFYVNRIRENDNEYNAVIELNPNALEYAKAIDLKILNGEELNELDGVVVLLKDNVSSKDMNTASGAYALKDLTTTRDSFIVEKMSKSGAIMLGKANLSEWSNFMSIPSSSGFSVLGGQTKNSYGKYDVGGSSAGSSVAASLNYASVTIGSETAGSLIFPAGQNSVVALKPTTGLMSRDLIIPISEAQDTAGVISKSVSDLRDVFKVMVKKDENDKATNIVDTFDMATLDTKLDSDFIYGKKFGYVDNGTPELMLIVEEFRSLGAEVFEIKLDKSANDIDMMSVLSYGIKNDVNAFLSNEAVISDMKNLSQIIEYNKLDDSRMPFGQAHLEAGLEKNLSKEAYEKIVDSNRINTREAIDKALLENNIEAIISISNELSGVYATAGYPAITVPSGYRDSGEPFGVTIVGGENSDGKLIDIAYAYEAKTKHRKVPLIK